MTQYILINRIKVQNANAVAGFTWGFPAITNFLGFTHSLSRQLKGTAFEDTSLLSCAVIAHEHHVHSYGDYKDNFTQSKNPPYMKGSTAKDKTPSVIEEGKMNMTVSLLVGFSGPADRSDGFLVWLKNRCLFQRLAGGTILSIDDVQVVDIGELNKRLLLKRKLLPGFVLIDRSDELEKHYQDELESNENAELMDAWLDFSLLKRKARPKSDLIKKYLAKYDKSHDSHLLGDWNAHVESGLYDQDQGVPLTIKSHFAILEKNKSTKAVLAQWENYLEPDNKTPADWEYIPKPSAGYLVPIMTGYKAISPLYKNDEIENTRDYETDVRFVESVHSVGEWRGVNRLREVEDFERCLWEYAPHELGDEWYLCRQITTSSVEAVESTAVAYSDDDY